MTCHIITMHIDKQIVSVTPRDIHYGRGEVMNKNEREREREIHCIQNSCSDNNNNNNNDDGK